MQPWVRHIRQLAQTLDVEGLKLALEDMPPPPSVAGLEEVWRKTLGVMHDVFDSTLEWVNASPSTQANDIQVAPYPNSLDQLETDIYQTSKLIYDGLHLAMGDPQASVWMENLMALHEVLLTVGCVVQKFFDEEETGRDVQGATQDMLLNYLCDGNIKISLLALDALRGQHILSQKKSMVVDERARVWMLPLFTSNIPKHENDQQYDGCYSSTDRWVMTLICDGLRRKSLHGQPLSVVDRLAQEDQGIFQSFSNIMNNPLLINQMFTRVSSQISAALEIHRQQSRQSVDPAGNTESMTPVKNSKTPLEEFYQVLQQENGLAHLGATALYAHQTNLRLHDAVRHRHTISSTPSSKKMM